MIVISTVLLGFFISLIISALIILLVTKLFGETEGFGTALLAALIGSIIYSLSFIFIGSATWAAIIAGIAWLIALSSLYSIGWIRSLLIAIVIWFIASLVSYFFPTVIGPL